MPEREIPSPEKFYGFQMGAERKLARWDKIVEYFWLLDKRTDRVKVVELGKSTEGNPFLLAIITSAENMKNLEKIREMSWRIAHPKGLSEKEVENIVKNGKTVVAITNSIHASEVGGTQMSSELAYEIATSEEPKYQKIRENTVLLLFPSFNPDGNIIVVDWYNKWLGTEYEATSLPRLYHKYTGHDNNRDAFTLTQVESQLVSKVLYREWFPQAYIDHHHMGGNGARYYIPPFANPIHEKVDPLIWTEQQLYGAAMIVNLERAGKTGIENSATYPGDFMPTFNYVPCWHNICGMLTESASARIATPTYVHLHQLTGGRRGRPEYRAQVNFPHPWPGGWWRLRDVVEQQKIASLATLEVAANFREMILKNMYLKAMRSIKKGEEEPPYAFVIPPYQHDILTAHKLLKNLRDLGVEIHLAKKSFTSNGISYPAGSHVIFLSQPSRPFLLSLLPRTFYRDSPHTRTSEGAPLAPYDFAAQTLAEFMGVKVVEIEKKFEGDFEEVETIEFPTGSVEISSGHGYILDGRLNDSFIAVNRLLKKDIEIFRAEEEVKIGETTYPRGSFIIPEQEGVAEALKEEAENLHITFHALDSEHEVKKHEVKALRVGMYQRYYGGNMDEGWTRWLLEKFEFPYTTLRDKEIKEGLSGKYDVLILPSDATAMITGEKLEEYYQQRFRGRMERPKVPEEYRSGIGKEGVQKVKEFVEAGGTLVALNRASDFAMEELKIAIFDALKDLKQNDFFCPGSTLKVNIDTTHPLAYGIAEDCVILFRGGSAFAIKPGTKGEDFHCVVTFPDERILQSGWLIGEQHLSRKAAVVDAKLGRGRVVLYGFSPQARAQTHATFKFLFNALIS